MLQLMTIRLGRVNLGHAVARLHICRRLGSFRGNRWMLQLMSIRQGRVNLGHAVARLHICRRLGSSLQGNRWILTRPRICPRSSGSALQTWRDMSRSSGTSRTPECRHAMRSWEHSGRDCQCEAGRGGTPHAPHGGDDARYVPSLSLSLSLSLMTISFIHFMCILTRDLQ